MVVENNESSQTIFSGRGILQRKLVLAFDFKGEILKCKHSNKSYIATLTLSWFKDGPGGCRLTVLQDFGQSRLFKVTMSD